MPKLTDIQGVGPGFNYASTPEQIQAGIDILTEFLADILSQRGSSIEEWNKLRKETVSSELAEIEAELTKLEADTDPLPV